MELIIIKKAEIFDVIKKISEYQNQIVLLSKEADALKKEIEDLEPKK